MHLLMIFIAFSLRSERVYLFECSAQAETAQLHQVRTSQFNCLRKNLFTQLTSKMIACMCEGQQ